MLSCPLSRLPVRYRSIQTNKNRFNSLPLAPPLDTRFTEFGATPTATTANRPWSAKPPSHSRRLVSANESTATLATRKMTSSSSLSPAKMPSQEPGAPSGMRRATESSRAAYLASATSSSSAFAAETVAGVAEEGDGTEELAVVRMEETIETTPSPVLQPSATLIRFRVLASTIPLILQAASVICLFLPARGSLPLVRLALTAHGRVTAKVRSLSIARSTSRHEQLIKYLSDRGFLQVG